MDLKYVVENADLSTQLNLLRDKLKLFLLALSSTREIELTIITAEISIPFAKIKSCLRSDIEISDDNQQLLKEVKHICAIFSEALDTRLHFELQLLLDSSQT